MGVTPVRLIVAVVVPLAVAGGVGGYLRYQHLVAEREAAAKELRELDAAKAELERRKKELEEQLRVMQARKGPQQSEADKAAEIERLKEALAREKAKAAKARAQPRGAAAKPPPTKRKCSTGNPVCSDID